MEEQAEPIPDQRPPKSNRSWFQKGDPRINRRGRPRGSKTGLQDADPAELAETTDHLMALKLPVHILRLRLSADNNFGALLNLSREHEIVSCRLDAGRENVVFQIRSPRFPRIARGARLPEFKPEYYGMSVSRG